jgi:hypothetical protein
MAIRLSASGFREIEAYTQAPKKQSLVEELSLAGKTFPRGNAPWRLTSA